MEKQTSNNIMGPSPACPAPTTFVQADANSFRDLVQKLTGNSSQDKIPARLSSRPAVASVDHTGIRRPPFKLQERRQHSNLRKLEVKLGLGNSPTSHLSPGLTHLSLSSPVQSPVTPLGSDSVFSARVGTDSPPYTEEERAIARKAFYLHPSPRKTQPPELLTLFPLTSPRQELQKS